MGIVQAAESFTVEPHSARIYVVEDDPAMQRLIVNYISEYNMRAIAASGRQRLMQLLASKEPDLIILDLNLGDEDGLDLLREVRTKSIVPVILITGNRSEEIDRVVGLELGADDYITKPFGLRELLARMRALLRRRSMDSLSPMRPDVQKYAFQGWLFDQRARRLHSPDGETVSLTKSEFALLSAFVAAPRRPLTREHLLQATRVHEDVFDRSIDVQILRLRRKLEQDSSAPKLIRTERGVGYIFDTEVKIV